MKAGVIVQLPDGRIGTVVYHGLDGVGIKFGRHDVTLDDIEAAAQERNTLFDEAPPDFPWHPDAMLREPYPGATCECVGRGYEVIQPEGGAK